MIRVLVVDDDPLTREWIREMLDLTPDVVTVGEATNGRDAIDLCRELQPDVVLLDLVMADTPGLEALPEIKVVCPAARVVAYTCYPADRLARPAVEAGADGYVEKVPHPGPLADLVRRAVRGERVFSPAARRALRETGSAPPVDGLLSSASHASPAVEVNRPGGEAMRGADHLAPTPHEEWAHLGLTERDAQVMGLVAQGLRTKQIAEQLSVSPADVSYHVHHTLKRLGAQTRAQAVAVLLLQAFDDFKSLIQGR